MPTVIRVLAYLVMLALTVWALLDIAQTPARATSILPKPLWLLVALVPLVGPALWFLFGRLEVDGHPANQRRSRPASSRPLGPDDDPEFLRNLGRRNDQP
jgi:hypothetical protein